MKRKHYRLRHDIRRELDALRRRLDNIHGPFALLKDLLLIGLAIWLCYKCGWWFYPISLVAIGALQRALSTIVHEASHFTIAKSRRLNEAIGWMVAPFILQSFVAYRKSHVGSREGGGHHPHLGDDERDPDYVFHAGLGMYDVRSPKEFLRRFIVAPFMGSLILPYLKYVVTHRLLCRECPPATKLPFVAVWIGLPLFAWWHGWLILFAAFWMVPLFTTSLEIGHLIEICEHFPNDGVHDLDIEMTWNRHSKWIERLLTGIHCEGYHLVHHLRPDLPFWVLPEAHRILMKDSVYAAHNNRAGGIFTSSNGAPTIIARQLEAVAACPHEQGDYELTA